MFCCYSFLITRTRTITLPSKFESEMSRITCLFFAQSLSLINSPLFCSLKVLILLQTTVFIIFLIVPFSTQPSGLSIFLLHCPSIAILYYAEISTKWSFPKEKKKCLCQLLRKYFLHCLQNDLHQSS